MKYKFILLSPWSLKGPDTQALRLKPLESWFDEAIERSFTKRNWRHVVMYAIDPTQPLREIQRSEQLVVSCENQTLVQLLRPYSASSMRLRSAPEIRGRGLRATSLGALKLYQAPRFFGILRVELRSMKHSETEPSEAECFLLLPCPGAEESL